MFFDHEKLNVYNVSLEFVSMVSRLTSNLKGDNRNAKDQLIRASQSIVLNIAEGNGKRSLADRRRFFEIARGSAMECAAVLDFLAAVEACAVEDVIPGKALLTRVVSMLSKMTEPLPNGARESDACYGANIDYEHEHEHEHEYETEETSASKRDQ